MSLKFIAEYRYTNGITNTANETREAHMAYRESINDNIVMVGPLIGSDDKPVGSILVLTASDLVEAEKIANGEPFVQAGVTEVLSVRLMRIAKLNA